MNLTDLSAELDARAAGVQPSPGTARLAAVRGRARRRRRRQVGAVAVIVTGCALAFAVGPTLAGLHRDRSAPPARTDHPLQPFTFDDVAAGDPLVAHVMGPAGRNEIELRFTPTDTNLSIHDFCYVARPKTSSTAGGLTINGHPSFKSSCSSDTLTTDSTSFGSGTAAANRAGWAKLGVIPGRESVLRYRLRTFPSATRLTDPSVRLGLGLYQLSGDRITSDGIVIKQDAETDGHNYRLAGYVTAPLTRSRRTLALPVPASRQPAYVLEGSQGVDERGGDRGNTELTVSGDAGGLGGTSGGTGSLVLDDAKAHTLKLTVDAATGNRGVMMLAYYVRAD